MLAGPDFGVNMAVTDSSVMADDAAFSEVVSLLLERWRAQRPPALSNEHVRVILRRVVREDRLQEYELRDGVRDHAERIGLIGRRGAPVQHVYGKPGEPVILNSVLWVLKMRMQAGVGASLSWPATTVLLNAAKASQHSDGIGQGL